MDVGRGVVGWSRRKEGKEGERAMIHAERIGLLSLINSQELGKQM